MTSAMIGLDGKVALVTGGSRGRVPLLLGIRDKLVVALQEDE